MSIHIAAGAIISAIIFVFTPFVYAESEPVLTVTDSKNKVYKFKRSELLKHPKLEIIHLPKNADPAHPGMAMTYKAIRAGELFKGANIDKTHVVAYECTDKFSAPFLPITSDVVLAEKSVDGRSAVAYVAVEDPQEPWPDLAKLHPGKHTETAGPFYLVWVNPKAAGISREEWPFKLAALKMNYSNEKAFPEIVPLKKNKGWSANVDKGYQVFVKNCFTCHTFNKAGTSEKGPDLNYPMSPIEYLGAKNLTKLIRDPKSVRFWPSGQMPGFSSEQLSDESLQQLFAYFKFMSANR